MLHSYALMLRCWDVEPTQRPVFCELSSSVAVIIAKMKAAAAANGDHSGTETDGGLRPALARYVNAVNTPSVAADYLRPLADRTTGLAEPADHPDQLDLSDSLAAAAADDVDNEASVSDFTSEADTSKDTDVHDAGVL